MAWTQVYDPMGGPVWSALVAGIPLISLFYMLAVRRAKGHYAAALAVALAFLLALFVWGMPTSTAFSALTYGAAFGLFPIIWIVVTAVWVYNMTVESGEFEYIKESLARLTDDRRLQAIFIAFAFGSFIEGTAGFGTPVAITAACWWAWASGPCTPPVSALSPTPPPWPSAPSAFRSSWARRFPV